MGEMVRAAGAIGSPLILPCAGFGAGARLRDAGVTPVTELPGVGENLRDHLQLRMAYRVRGVATLNERANSLLGKVGIGPEYLPFRRGPMSMSPGRLGAFAKSDDAQASPDLE